MRGGGIGAAALRMSTTLPRRHNARKSPCFRRLCRISISVSRSVRLREIQQPAAGRKPHARHEKGSSRPLHPSLDLPESLGETCSKICFQNISPPLASAPLAPTRHKESKQRRRR